MSKRGKSSKWLARLGLFAIGYMIWQEVWRRTGRNSHAALQPGEKQGCALVTGASSGIGLEFARQLAARGYDLILVARRQGRLQAIADELSRDWNVAVQVVQADLAHEGDLRRVEEVIQAQTDLSFLVNNAGFGLEGQFIENDVETELNMVDLHVQACVQLTRAALPGMVNRARGSVVNVSSLSAFVPGPGRAIYSATKAYLNNFTESLFLENRRHGVKFQALCPGLTVTEFHEKIPGFRWFDTPAFLWMSAVEVVRLSLDALDGGTVVFVPGIINQAIAIVAANPIFAPFIWLGVTMLH